MHLSAQAVGAQVTMPRSRKGNRITIRQHWTTMNIKGYSLGNVSKVISTPLTGCLSTVVHGKVCQIPFQPFLERGHIGRPHFP